MFLDRLDIERLVAPVSVAAACGNNLRISGDADAYFRLKDARSLARSSERNLSPGEPFRLSPLWGEVRSGALALLAESQDLELLAWLCEAEVRLSGFRGLADAFLLTAQLVSARFEELHSIDGEDLSDKVAPFAGLNGVSGEGTLIQPLRLVPLVPGLPFFEASLWDHQISLRPGEEERRQALRDAAHEAGSTAMRAHLEDVSACLSAYRALTEAFEASCGADAPASSAVRAVLEEARQAVQAIAGLDDVAPGAGEAAPMPGADTTAAVAPAAAVGVGAIRSREEAFQRLTEVADYFRRAEPQSPLSMAIETVVARGRMNFTELLAELVSDEHARRSILVTAGIRAAQNEERF
ncbi:type VI secretion system protein TssA [Xanthobacteraceae bacterium A53D]